MLRCTERDKKLISKCAICRWLTTTQIQRLYFPGKTVNAVQKRLRKLADEGCLRIHREGTFSEALYTAGPKGRAILEENGLAHMGEREVPKQLAHLTGINDVRISVETGTVPVAYFLASWQFASMGWRHPVIPDAIFAVSAPARRTFAVEFDRATEGLPVLTAKLRAYQGGVPGFPFEAVVIVTERERRMEPLNREVRKDNVPLRVLVGTLAELQEKTVGDCSFLDLAHGGGCGLLDPPRKSEK